jgi:hypothetical protein
VVDGHGPRIDDRLKGIGGVREIREGESRFPGVFMGHAHESGPTKGGGADGKRGAEKSTAADSAEGTSFKVFHEVSLCLGSDRVVSVGKVSQEAGGFNVESTFV